MAIGTPTLRFGGTTNTVTTLASSSFTPAVGSIVFVAIGTRIGASTTTASIAVSDNRSGTWTLIGAQIPSANGTSSPSTRLAVFRRVISASESLVVTGSHSESERLTMHVWEVTGASNTITNTDTDANNAGDMSLAISSPNVASAVFAIGVFGGSDAPTAPLTVQLAETIGTPQAIALETSYTLTGAGTSASWTTGANRSASLMFELPVAPIEMTGAGTIAPLVGAGVAVQGQAITGAGTIRPLTGLGIISVDTAIVGAGIIAPLVGAGVMAQGYTMQGAGTLLSLTGFCQIEHIPPPPPDTFTLVIWSRCDRCGLRARSDQLVREPDTSLYVHSHCLDDISARRRGRRPPVRFRNPRPDTELENNR
jgi:hypothetical protein